MENYLFNEEFQISILANMLQDIKFVVTNPGVIQAAFFTEDYLQDIAQIILSFVSKYSIPPTPIALEEELKILLKNPHTKDLVDDYIEISKSLYTYDIEPMRPYIRDRVIEFGRQASVRRALIDVAEQVDKGNLEVARNLFIDSYKIGLNVSAVGYNYLDEAEDRFNKYNMPVEEGIPTGISDLDKLLYGGGVHPGWFCFVIGPSGSGKSILLQNITKHAVTERKKVWYISLEMPVEQLSRRFDSMFTGVTLRDLKDSKCKLIDCMKAQKAIGGNLKITFFPRRTVNTNNLNAYLECLRDNDNFIPDLIVVDYADEMLAINPTEQNWLNEKAIFTELTSWAQSIGIPVWTASQANGGGYELQRKKLNLDMDNASGSKSKGNPADVVATLVCLDKNQEDQTGILQMFVAKNRDGESRVTIRMNVDYKTMRVNCNTSQMAALRTEDLDDETKQILLKLSASYDVDKQ
jgi:replicative DNA helicase